MRRLLPRLAVLALAVSFAPPLTAQSGTTAVISGTIVAADGMPIPGSLVTLTSLDRARSYEETSDGAGAFRFSLVAPGSYELRAEGLGYRPVVARTITLTGGGRASVTLPMAQAPPPVLTVDTISVGAAGASRFEAGAVRLGVGDLEGLPYRYEDLGGVAVLAPGIDASLGTRGLPGSMTMTVVDGVPVYGVPHPVARSEQLAGPAFPRSVLSGVRVSPGSPDMEWSGRAGGRIATTTRTGTPGEGLSLGGAWSGDPLWSSSELDSSTPSLMSFRGSGRTTVPVSPGTSSVLIAGDVMREETPLAQRITEPVATSLAGLDPDLIATLSAPSVERYSRFSGLARFDAQPGSTSHLFVRAAAGYAKREFDGSGPLTLAGGAALPEENIEYSVAGGYIRELSPSSSFEFRGGVSAGTRTFDAANEGMPAAFLAGSGSALGFLAAGTGESSRTDLVLSPVLNYSVGSGSLKFGPSLRLTKHSMLHSRPADFLFSDGASLVAGQGYVGAVSAPETSFSTQEFGVFAQLDSEPAAGLRTSLGARFDYERIPGGEAALNTAWLQASGLANDVYPSSFNQMGAGASATWTPDTSTEVFAGVSVHHGDVDSRVLGQLFSRDQGATSTMFAGTGVTWPGALPAAAPSLPTLTMVGPGTRAPRSMEATAGLVKELATGWSAHVGGSFRRTDFLMRRRNLNLPLTAQAADPNGRAIYGTLVQDGSLVTATGTDARRFGGFGPVSALDPDGWSEYLGVTGGLEYGGAAADLFVTYTYSETTDNWIGGATGLAESELAPSLPEVGWSDGTSDFDVPHRVTAAATARVSRATLSAAYHFRSGYPFTPGYRAGVDANGDGSFRNDVAYVDAGVVDPLLSDWACLDSQLGDFAVRNSCRGPSVHSVDVRVQVSVGRLAGREAHLVVDGFNLIENSDGIVDDALLLVDPTGNIATSAGVVTIPLIVNPDFGRVLYPTSRGRMIRIGFRIG